jgi:hypothetical protein
MSHTASAHPSAPSAPGAGNAWSLWTPGLRLMRGLRSRSQALLVLSSWLPLAAAALLWQGAIGGAAMDSLGAALDGRWDASALRWALSGLLLLTLLASAYLAVCAWLSLAQRLQRQDEAAAAQTQRLREMSARQSSVLAEAQAAMALQQAELRAAVGELARRTVALCGMLDAGVGDAARAAADLEAIQDEERHALQLMSSLRARLLSLAQHCQALGDAASAAAPSQLDAAPGSVAELSACAAAEIAHCHQLSERVGGAERLNERRIDSMRRNMERLQYRGERGLLDGQQLMVLTRQMQVVQGAAQRSLEQIAQCSQALGAFAADAAPPAAGMHASA